MALNISQYIAYLGSIVAAPEPKPVVVIPEDEVKYFNPGVAPQRERVIPMRKISVPAKKADLFPTKPFAPRTEPEVVIAYEAEEAPVADDEDWGEEFMPDEGLLRDEQGSLEETVLYSITENPLWWAKQQVLMLNPWQVADEWFKTLTHTDGGAMALEFLIERTAKVTQAKPELDTLVDRLYFAAVNEIDAYDAAWNAQEDAKQRRQKYTWPENVRRPAELYRAYVKPLRKAKALGYHVQSPINDLVLMQNRPLDELETPAWIDAYTGEVDPDSDILHIRGVSDVEKDEELIGDPNEIVGTIDVYGPEGGRRVRQPITRAQQFEMRQMEARSSIGAEGFNSEDDLDEEWFDDRDPLTPTWQEIATELNPQNLGELSREFKPYRDELRKCIERSLDEVRQEAAEEIFLKATSNAMFELVAPKTLLLACWDAVAFPLKRHPELSSLSYGVYKQHGDLIGTLRADIFRKARSRIRKSAEAKNVLDWLQRKADAQEFPVDLVRIFLGLQHGLGFEEEDCAEVKLSGPYATLYDFMEDNWEEISEQLISGSLGRPYEISQAEIEVFAKETVEETARLEGDLNAKEITHHPAYIRGFLTAMINAKDITSTDDNGAYHNTAVEAGWDSWREWKSPDGNKAYHAAKAAGKDQKEAMRAFWQMVNRPRVIGINPDKSGLTLQYADKQRKINWYVAVLKVKGNELNITPEERKRLKAKLLGLGWGGQLCQVL